MRSNILLLLCLCTFLYTRAQDTICKRTGECFGAKVLEIGITDVKFRRADNLDGPLFIYNKNEIKKIKYASGAIDTFALVKEAPKPAYAKKPGMVSTLDFNRVEPAGRSCIFTYRGRLMSDRGLIYMARAKNETWHDQELTYEARKTKESKLYQYLTGLGGIGVGLAGLTALSYSGAYSGLAVSGLLLDAGLVVAAEIFSFRFKMQRNSHAKRVAALYNAHLN